MSRVLLVDDEPQLLRALRINLAARHFDVVTAEDGTGALEAAATHPPDLVVLDLGLPDLDGVEVIRRLRVWTAVPIIVLSGRVGSSDKVLALDAGADDYVTNRSAWTSCSPASGPSPGARPAPTRAPRSSSAGSGSTWPTGRSPPTRASRRT